LFVYYLPALAALLVKLTVVVLAKRTTQKSKVFISLLIILCAHNTAEVISIISLNYPALWDIALNYYYITNIAAQAYILFFSYEVAFGKLSKLVVLSVAACFTFSLTEAMVSGVISLGYTITAVRGEYYFIFQFGSILTLLFSISFLVTGIFCSTSKDSIVKCLCVALSILPILVTGFAVIIFMQLGWKVSGAVLLPLSTSLFLAICLMTENKHGFTDIKKWLPMPENLLRKNKAKQTFQHFIDGKISYTDAKDQLNIEMLSHSIKSHNGNISATGRKIDIDRGTLYSMMRRLKIKNQWKE